MQYFGNNHPFFGICCHHKLHPVKFRERIFILIGSIAFGLAITNMVVIWFLYYSDEDFDGAAFTISFNANLTLGSNRTLTVDDVSVSNGQIFLWTVGSMLHSCFDLTTWYIAAMACCQAGGCCQCLGSCKMLGSYLVIFIVVVLSAVATFFVVLRASTEDDEDFDGLGGSAGVLDDEIDFSNVDSASDFEFLISFCIELVAALFLWYFVSGTILFSGILGCGKLPLLGGRPREIMLEEKENAIKRSRTADTDYYP